jgi:hypothetical protein
MYRLRIIAHGQCSALDKKVKSLYIVFYPEISTIYK